MNGKEVTLITGAGLESALVQIISLTKGDIKVQLSKLSEDLKVYNAQPAPLDAAISTQLEDFEKLKLEVVEKDKTIEKLNGELTVAGNTVKELKVQLEGALEVKAENSDQLIVEVKKVKYIVNHGSFPHSAAEIAADPELASELLKIEGQNVLTKL